MICDGLASRPGGVEILLAASCYRNRGISRNSPSCFLLQKPGISSRSYDPVGSKASFFFLFLEHINFLYYCIESKRTQTTLKARELWRARPS